MPSSENMQFLSEIGIDPKNFSVDEWKGKLRDVLKSVDDPEKKVFLARSFINFVVAVSPDLIDGVFDIRIAERVENRAEGEDCFGYIHGVNVVDSQAVTDDMTTNCEFSLEPVVGAFALYVDLYLNPRHIGRVNERGNVVSKWGVTGHVYEHNPYMVPISYGDIIAYYIPPQSPSIRA